MMELPGSYVTEQRQDLTARARLWAQGRAFVESYGDDPVIISSRTANGTAIFLIQHMLPSLHGGNGCGV
jgi:hypothetical protein